MIILGEDIMKKRLRVISLFLAAILVLTAFSGCAQYTKKIKHGNAEKITSMQVKSDGKLRVLVITDTHLIGNGKTKRDRQTLRWVEEAINKSNPDLVICSGDITGNPTKGRDGGILAFANFMEARQIYWTYVFGNHDGEHGTDENGKEAELGKDGKRTEVTTVCKNFKYDKSQGEIFFADNTRGNKQIFDLLQGYEYCLLRQDPSEQEHSTEMGIGNYTFDIVDKNGNIVYAFIFMDSHGKIYFDSKDNKDGKDGYQSAGYLGLTDIQIDWYRKTAKKYADLSVKTGLFMHVPSYGYRELLEVNDEPSPYGVPRFKERTDIEEFSKYAKFKDTKFLKKEGIYGPYYDDGLEQAIDEFKTTNLITVGHDHNNCFYLTKDISSKYKDEVEKANEIILAYARCSGVNAWGRQVKIGATIYDIDTNATSLEDMYDIEEIYPSFKYVEKFKAAQIDSSDDHSNE